MNNNNNSNYNLLDDFTANMYTVSEKKIKSELQISFVILSLIPWTIYGIVIYFFMTDTWKKQSSLQFSISDFDNFYRVSCELSYKILIATIILIFFIFIVSIISTINISKYKIKKEYIKSLIKNICILQLIIFSVMLFFFCINYYNAISGIPSYIDRFEWLESQSKSKNQNITYNFNKNENKIKRTYNINLAIEIFFEVICSIISIKFQEKIIMNSVVYE